MVDYDIRFYENNDVDSTDFSKAMKIYIDSFPAHERHSVETIKERVRNGSYKLFIGRSDGEVVFMALFWSLQGTKFVLFDYMAIKENIRNRGVGTYFMSNMHQILNTKDVNYILEVEDPRQGENKEQREKRVAFYKKNGLKEMKDVRYILPPLSGTTPTEMILMLLPKQQELELSGNTVKSVITQIYRELYGRDENDQLLNSFIHDVPHTIRLL